jgi:uncharacterized heparinase superfamily protein
MNLAPAHEWSHRLARRSHALAARARHRLGLDEPAPASTRLSADFRHPADAAERARLISLYRKRFPESMGEEMREAERLLAHRFSLLGTEMEHGERIAWSLDPVSGEEWPRGFSPQIVYRGEGRLGDIKLPWELAKQQYFFTLGKASWVLGDPAYAREIVRQIEDWIADNPPLRGIHWISALEAGTRIVSWVLAWPFYRDFVTPELRRLLARSIAQQLAFVERNLSLGPYANTHLVGEAASLVAGGLFLGGPQARHWRERGVAILEQEISRQVTADGVHAERSVAYHRFFLDQYHLSGSLLEANGGSFSVQTWRAVEHMSEFLRDVIRPDGSVPDFGDNDDARGLWLHAASPGDYRGLLALAAARFGRGDFKSAAGDSGEELLWLSGADDLLRFDALPEEEPTHRSWAYRDAGYYVVRSGWRAEDSVLAFDCGPLGHGHAAHGHADALSFQLYARGYPFFIDSGTFSYNDDYAWRDAFRGTHAHNTVIVDGCEQSEPGDRMRWKSQARSRLHRWVCAEGYELVDGEHDGYQRLADPVRHRRVLVFVKPDLWLVLDVLQAKDCHEIESLLHLRPDCGVESRSRGVTLRAPDGAALRLACYDERAVMHPPVLERGQDGNPTAWTSPAYGVRVPARTLRVRRGVSGSSALLTVFSTSPQRMPTVSQHEQGLSIAVPGPKAGLYRFVIGSDVVFEEIGKVEDKEVRVQARRL